MAVTSSSISHLAQAPIEVAVRAALAARGRFDRDDVDRAMTFVMHNLSPDTLRAIAANPTGSAHLLEAVIPQATANIAVTTRPPTNWYGPVGDPSHFGTGRAWGGHRWGAGSYAAPFGDSDGEGGSGTSGSSLRYVGMDIAKINSHNYASTDFHRSGIDYGTFSELRSQGFSGQNIMNAARDARALGFRANDREAMHDHAIIDRYSIDARGMNTALRDYQRRTREDAELNALIDQRCRATTEEHKRALDAQIAARRREHEEASGEADVFGGAGY